MGSLYVLKLPYRTGHNREAIENFESNAIPSQIERTGSIRIVARRDSGRRAYTEVFTACPERICPVELALLVTALVKYPPRALLHDACHICASNTAQRLSKKI